MSNEYKAANAALESRCAELEKQLEDAISFNYTAASAKSKADEEISGLNARVADLEEELSRLRESEALKTSESDALKQRLAEFEETLGMYEKSKERIALLELNASRRAVNIEKAAEEKAADLTRRCTDLIDALKSEYEKICNDTESTTAHIKGEMDKLGVRLVNLSETLSGKAEALSQLDSIINHGLEDSGVERF
jgi:chromosome segregation ATPase